jgi:signal transduction histidine kinase/CheY-like chemotaxis protein
MKFRDLPIRRKLLLLTLASSAPALVLASSGFLTWDITQYRGEIRQDIEAQAAIVADNSTAPLAFGDRQAAAETLAVMRLRPRVTMACLYASDGAEFAAYRRDGSSRCPTPVPATANNGWDHFSAISPIVARQNQLGTLYIERDLDDVFSRLRVGALTVGALLLIAIGAAFLIARRIQHFIASPLLELAATARNISTGHHDSLRATTVSNDEVGVVVHAFNAMLDRISERNTELSRANEELAREVDERRRLEVERTAALERERDANRLKDEFLATLSHELRTPLNAVLGWTRVLRTTNREGQARERALESIERNARAQARLIEDLLEVSRIVTGKLRIHTEPVDLAAIVEAAVEVVQPAAVAKHIALTTHITVRPAMTLGDADRLQQVVWNLTSNAVKFTPPDGAATVRLSLNNGFRIEVTDTGQGIEPRFLSHVFEPFRQADGTPSREQGGLGLGLAIARQLVELHGGTIEARSDGPGRGSSFEVRLPSVIAPAARRPSAFAELPTAPAPRPDPMPLRDLRVLVVDDQQDARELLEATLEQYGAHVIAAESAAAALAEIKRYPPDVLLSDIGMPRENGYELIRRLRDRPPGEGGEVPAIAVTAYASLTDRVAALTAGYQAHIAKPFEPEELVRLVATLGRAASIGPS